VGALIIARGWGKVSMVKAMAIDLSQQGEGILLALRREAMTLLPPDLY
jgi:predicted AAA+ superfamily ATPase